MSQSYLFDNLYKPEDLFGDRIVPFKGEARQQVEDRIVKTLHDIMSQTKNNALVNESWNNNGSIFKILP